MQPPFNNRGIFRTGKTEFMPFAASSGRLFHPDDGPVGKMLGALGRHPWRPAHMHFRSPPPAASGLITHLFVAGDAYLTSDAVFGVKESLIVDFQPVDSGTRALAGRFRFRARAAKAGPRLTVSHRPGGERGRCLT